MGGSKPRSLKLFYCYAHEDAEYRAGLNKHLVMLKHEKVIEQWYDGEILAGTEWDRTIKENLESADIVLLLVSADFLASKYISEVELKRAMERHEEGTARVVPVILRSVDNWQSAPFGKLQACPKGGRPVSTWPRHLRDEPFADVAASIRLAAESIRAGNSEDSKPEQSANIGEPKIGDVETRERPSVTDAEGESSKVAEVKGSRKRTLAWLAALAVCSLAACVGGYVWGNAFRNESEAYKYRTPRHRVQVTVLEVIDDGSQPRVRVVFRNEGTEAVPSFKVNALAEEVTSILSGSEVAIGRTIVPEIAAGAAFEVEVQCNVGAFKAGSYQVSIGSEDGWVEVAYADGIAMCGLFVAAEPVNYDVLEKPTPQIVLTALKVVENPGSLPLLRAVLRNDGRERVPSFRVDAIADSERSEVLWDEPIAIGSASVPEMEGGALRQVDVECNVKLLKPDKYRLRVDTEGGRVAVTYSEEVKEDAELVVAVRMYKVVVAALEVKPMAVGSELDEELASLVLRIVVTNGGNVDVPTSTMFIMWESDKVQGWRAMAKQLAGIDSGASVSVELPWPPPESENEDVGTVSIALAVAGAHIEVEYGKDVKRDMVMTREEVLDHARQLLEVIGSKK